MKSFFSLLVIFCCCVLSPVDAYGREVVVVKNGQSLSKQIVKPNVDYQLSDDFDLKGSTLLVPKNCVLYGAWNTLRNGTVVVSEGCDIYALNFEHSKIVMTDVAKVRIRDCKFTGSFSISDLKEQNFTAAAIYGTGLEDICIESISIQGYQWGVSFVKSSKLDISNVSFCGILDEPIDYEKNIENSNYHDAVVLSKSHFCNISKIYAKNCGACVLLGGSSNLNVIESCKGELLWDNGVYISSGHNNIVQNCVFRSVRGCGVKARGNCNVVANNSVIGVGTGYAITGFGSARGSDEFGKQYNGYGSVVNGNIVQNAKNCGISIGLHGGLPFYRCSATNNSIVDCGENGSAISVFCNYATITGNNVVCPKSFGIVVAQVADEASGGYMISENNIKCSRKGIVLQKCSKAVVSNNVIAAEKQGIVVSLTEDSSFILNKFSGKGKYSVSGSKKGTSNFYKTFGDNDSLVPSEFVRIEK